MRFLMLVLLLAPVASAEEPTTEHYNPWDYSLVHPVPTENMRDLDTDRPSKANSPYTVDVGHLQIETSIVDYVFDRDRYRGSNVRADNFNVFQSNVRVGVTPTAEVNVVVTPIEFSRSTDFNAAASSRFSGYGDTVLGGKWTVFGAFHGDAVGDFGLGLQPQIKFPTARASLGNGHLDVFLNIPMQLTIAPNTKISLTTSPQWTRSSNNLGRVLGWDNAIEIDHVFFKRLDVYAEFYAHVANERRKPLESVDVGAAYQIGDNVQLDAGINIGLNHATADLEVDLGVSWRI